MNYWTLIYLQASYTHGLMILSSWICTNRKILFLSAWIEDIQCFDIEYGIYFTTETGFFIFTRVRSASKNRRKKPRLSREINSIFSVKSINFYNLYTCLFQILNATCKTWRDVTVAYYFHTVKVNFLIFSQLENNGLWRYHFYSIDKTRFITALNIMKVKSNIHSASFPISTRPLRLAVSF